MSVAALPSPAVKPARRPEATWLPLAGIIAIGLAARLWKLSAQSLSMDEVFEVGLALKPAARIVGSHDGFPPLYHLLAHGWLRLTGAPESLRILSVILGTLTIVVIWRLGRLAAGERCGRVSGLLLAISPVHVWVSQEARAYALYFLLAVASIWLFYRARRSDSPLDWGLYGATAVLSAYTHYYMVLLIVTLLLTAVTDSPEPRPWRRMGWAHLALGIACLPLLYLVQGDLDLQQSIDPTRPPINLVALGYAGFTFLGGYTLGPSLRELHTMRAAEAVRLALPWVLLVGGAAAYLVAAAILDRSRRVWVWRLGLLVILPLGMCGVLGVAFGVGFRVRYVVWCAAPLLALLALGASRRPDRWPTRAALVALAIAAAFALLNRQLLPRHMNEDMRGAARYLLPATATGTPIFVAAAYMAPPLQFYLRSEAAERNVRPIYRADWVGEGSPPMARLRAAAGIGRPFWLVYSRAFDGDPKGRLLDSLKVEAGLTRRAVLPGVELYEGTGFQR
jgi:hypothetical protein